MGSLTGIYQSQRNLIKSAYFGKLVNVKTIIDSARVNINTNVRLYYSFDNFSFLNDSNSTPLIIACARNHYNIIEYLIKKKANVNSMNNDGMSPLLYSCQNGNIEITNLLLHSKANIHTKNKKGSTPLHLASYQGVPSYYEPSSSLSYKNGVNYDRSEYKKGNVDITRILIKNNADINSINNNGYTPIAIACELGHIDIMKLIIKKSGCGIFNKFLKNKTIFGDTLLILACWRGYKDIARFLIKIGADPNIYNNQRESALDFIKDDNFKKEIKLLRNEFINKIRLKELDHIFKINNIPKIILLYLDFELFNSD